MCTATPFVGDGEQIAHRPVMHSRPPAAGSQTTPPSPSSVSFGMRRPKNGQAKTSCIQCRMLLLMLTNDLLSHDAPQLKLFAQQLQAHQDRDTE